MDKEQYIKRLMRTYKWKESRIRDVFDVCEKYNIEPYGTVFMRTPEDVEAIILMLKERGINADNMKMCFRRNAQEVADILAICDKFNMSIDSIIFDKSPTDLLKSVRYVGVTFGRCFVC